MTQVTPEQEREQARAELEGLFEQAEGSTPPPAEPVADVEPEPEVEVETEPPAGGDGDDGGSVPPPEPTRRTRAVNFDQRIEQLERQRNELRAARSG